MSTNRTQSIRIRVTPEEKEHVEATARAAGMTVSDYSRAALFASPQGNGTTAVSTGLTRVTSNAALYATTSHVDAVAETLSQRVASLEEAISRGTTHIKKKPTT